jgi:hypothetical protein
VNGKTFPELSFKHKEILPAGGATGERNVAKAKKGAVNGATMAVQIRAQVAPIEAPLESASSVQLTVAGNEVTLLFLRNRPMSTSAGAQISLTAEVVTMVQMSHQTLKDLSIVLNGAVQNLEKEWGEIVTPFTRQQAEKH